MASKKTLSQIVRGFRAYDYFKKEELHRAGRRALQNVANALGLAKGEYDLRSNKAGDAVSGEVTLHTDHWYVQLQADSCTGRPVLFRLCNGRKDYCGFRNLYATAEALEDAESFALTLRRLLDDRLAHGGPVTPGPKKISEADYQRFAVKPSAA